MLVVVDHQHTMSSTPSASREGEQQPPGDGPSMVRAPAPHHRRKKGRKFKAGRLTCTTSFGAFRTEPTSRQPNTAVKEPAAHPAPTAEAETADDHHAVIDDIGQFFSQPSWDQEHPISVNMEGSSRHARRKDAQWNRWQNDIIPVLIPIYQELMFKTNYLKDDVVQQENQPCSCGLAGRKLDVFCIDWQGKIMDFLLWI